MGFSVHMRSSKSRNRSKSNRNNRSAGNIINRVFDSSGPEGKVRGTPQQIIDKYQQLTRDAQLAGDRVAAENFQQHAEHYMRMLSEAQRELEAKREQQDRENRERQAQRDQERAERAAASETQDPSDAPQPDVSNDTAGDETLVVDTPEEKTAKSKRKPTSRRAPKEPKGNDAPVAEVESAAPENAD